MTAERTAEELLTEFERTGRPEPFEEIVRRYSGMVYHVCHRITRDRHDAEDATQAVFSALAVGRKKESGEIRTIGPWLRQVARRVSLDIRRGKQRRQRRETLCATDGSSVDAAPEAGNHGLDAEELKQLIKAELDKLPVKYRLPLVLHYFGGMSQEDMAKELGCRPGTLRVRLHRGRHMLGRRLAKHGVTIGAVVFAVAITRAVQSTLTESLAMHFTHGHAATAGGVIQAVGTPVAAMHGVGASKAKVACAILLAGACVVRAGAEVYQYIRPLQLRIPTPVNLERIVPPLLDSIELPMRVDATPAAEQQQQELPAPAVAAVPQTDPLPVPPAVSNTTTGTGSSIQDIFAHRPATVIGPAPMVWSPSVAPAVTRSPLVGLGSPGLVGPTYAPVAPAPRYVAPFSAAPYAGRGGAAVAGVPSPAGGGSARIPHAPWATPPAPDSVDPTLPDPAAPVSPPIVNNPQPATPDPIQPYAIPGGSLPSPVAPTPIAIALAPTAPPVVTNSDSVMLGSSYKSGNVFSMGDVGPATPASVVQADPSRFNFDASDSSTRTYAQTATTLSGHGAVPPGTTIDNSGVVTASAPVGTLASLDLSQARSISNSIDNPANGRNGWYALSRSKLVLPALTVPAGDSAVSWGENQDDATPDLVNSVRLGLNDVAAPGGVQISLVAPDRPDAPLIPPTERVIGLWQFETTAEIAGGIDLLVRYDAYRVYALGSTDQAVRLIDFRSSWRNVADESFVLDPAAHLVGGRVGGNVRFFAVSVPADPQALPPLALFPAFAAVTPEPAAAGLLFVAGTSLLLRRRRRMKM